MALVPAILSISWIDSEGVKASTPLYFQANDASTLGAIITQAMLFVSDINVLSEDGITKATLGVELTGTPVGGSPATDSDSEEGLLINYDQFSSRYVFEVWIPALIDALIVNKKIDLSNAALVAFNTLMETPNTDLNPVSKYQLALTALHDAAESFRKLRRQALKKSRSTP